MLASLFFSLILSSMATAQILGDPDLSGLQADTPAPPAVIHLNHLIDLEMPASSSVKMSIDAKNIDIDKKNGVLHYIVIAQGPSAWNASYESIHCPSGRYKIHARKSQQEQDWEILQDSDWLEAFGQKGVLVRHPAQLIRSGLCQGTVVIETPDQAVRLLKADSVQNFR